MATPALDPAVHKLIREYARQGLSKRKIRQAIAQHHGIAVAVGTVFKFAKVACPAEKELHYTGRGIRSDKKVGSLSWREWAGQLKEMQELKRKGSYSQDRAVIELGDGLRPVALANFSDQHMGSWGCNYDGLVAITDELKRTEDLYIALTGDIGQYSIKLRSVLEVSDNLLPPEQQTAFIESWFDEIWHKVAFATWDNHGIERQEKLAGESSLKKTLSRKVVYFNGIGHVDLKVGNQIYRGAVSHKFRGKSFLNPIHALQRYMRFEGTDREWAMMGDTHQPGLGIWTDGDKTRCAINSGSLQENSGFGKRYFSLSTHPVYPIIVFYPDEHRIQPFWSVRDWLKVRGKM